MMRAIAAVPRVIEAMGLRAGKIRDIEFRPGQSAVVITGTDAETTAELGAEGLAALLVAYCSRVKIPLPRQGQKTVEVTSRSVLLRVATVTHGEEPLNGVRADFPRAMIWKRGDYGTAP